MSNFAHFFVLLPTDSLNEAPDVPVAVCSTDAMQQCTYISTRHITFFSFAPGAPVRQ